MPRYASDLSDAEWALIEPFMPVRKLLGRPRETDLRAVLDAILYIAWLPMADAAERLFALHDSARVFLSMARYRPLRAD